MLFYNLAHKDEKLYMTPFMFFYKKTFSENVIDSIDNIYNLLKKGKRLEYMKKIVHDFVKEFELNNFIFLVFTL